MRHLLTSLFVFVVGVTAIAFTLTFVSGDAHIHVGAPAGTLGVWFVVWIIWSLETRPE